MKGPHMLGQNIMVTGVYWILAAFLDSLWVEQFYHGSQKIEDDGSWGGRGEQKPLKDSPPVTYFLHLLKFPEPPKIVLLAGDQAF
jgi:hypothetical protein